MRANACPAVLAHRLAAEAIIRVADALNRLFKAVGYTILFLMGVVLLFSEDARAVAGDVITRSDA